MADGTAFSFEHQKSHNLNANQRRQVNSCQFHQRAFPAVKFFVHISCVVLEARRFLSTRCKQTKQGLFKIKFKLKKMAKYGKQKLQTLKQTLSCYRRVFIASSHPGEATAKLRVKNQASMVPKPIQHRTFPSYNANDMFGFHALNMCICVFVSAVGQLLAKWFCLSGSSFRRTLKTKIKFWT